MNHTMLNADFATSQCVRFTALSESVSRDLASILRISNLGSRVLSRGLFGIYSTWLSSLNKADFLGWRNCTLLPFPTRRSEQDLCR
jgi:hypothetical protein